MNWLQYLSYYSNANSICLRIKLFSK